MFNNLSRYIVLDDGSIVSKNYESDNPDFAAIMETHASINNIDISTDGFMTASNGMLIWSEAGLKIPESYSSDPIKNWENNECTSFISLEVSTDKKDRFDARIIESKDAENPYKGFEIILNGRRETEAMILALKTITESLESQLENRQNCYKLPEE